MSKEETVKDALEKPEYSKLFKIETTTSVDAWRRANQCLESDPANELLNERIKYDNQWIKDEKTGFEEMQKKDPVVRPKGISLKMKKRTCGNCIKYSVYKTLRFLFVSVWFYYIPLVVVMLTNIAPVFTHWKAK